jgi:hypothetical protein
MGVTNPDTTRWPMLDIGTLGALAIKAVGYAANLCAAASLHISYDRIGGGRKKLAKVKVGSSHDLLIN